MTDPIRLIPTPTSASTSATVTSATPQTATTPVAPSLPTPSASSVLQTAANTLLDQLNLRQNQLFEAIVARASINASSREITLTLNINGQEIPVQSPQLLTTGTLIKLMRSGAELRVMTDLIASTAPSTTTTPAPRALSPALVEMLNHEIARILPKQLTLSTGLSQLTSAANQAALSPPARAVVEALVATMPKVTSNPAPGNASITPTASPVATAPTALTTPAALREQVQGNGTLFEPRLAALGAPPVDDLKGRLLTLVRVMLPQLPAADVASVLRELFPAISPELLAYPLAFPQPSRTAGQTPLAAREQLDVGQLLKVIAGLLNRLNLHQMNSLLQTHAQSSDNITVQTWMFELPFLNEHKEARTIQIRLEEHAERENTERRRPQVLIWRLQLALDLDELGPVTFDLTLDRNNRLETDVWATRPATLSTLREHMGLLQSRMSALGLDVARLDCRAGAPPLRNTRLEQRLVDVSV